ncbi:aldo/keto reductase [Gemmatimonadota bacterium]
MKRLCPMTRRTFMASAGAGLAGTLLSSSCGADRNAGPAGLLDPLGDLGQSAVAPTSGRRPGLTSSDSRIPMRSLGNTGLEISILGHGGGSQFLVLGEGDWQAELENAVQAGVNIFDTSPPSSSYGPNGESEKRYGQILSEKYRDKVILSTKVDSRIVMEAETQIEGSFQNLRTDVIDILMIHGLEPYDDLSGIISDNGVWGLMKRLKEEGRVRFIGASVMYDPGVALAFAHQAEPDVLLLAMNPFTKGSGTPYADFEDSALAEIRGLGIGVMTMKALRDMVGTGPSLMSVDKLLGYNWSMDVSTVLVGHTKLSELEYNLELAATQHQPTGLSPEELAWIRRRAQQHSLVPCWMKPGYRRHELKT